MKIAVALNEKDEIAKHFGHCNTFLILEVENESIASTEKRIAEQHDHHHEHHEHTDDEHEHHHHHQLQILKDCQAVICKGMGHRAADALASQGIHPVVMTGEGSPEEAAILFTKKLLQQKQPHQCCCQHKHHH